MTPIATDIAKALLEKVEAVCDTLGFGVPLRDMPNVGFKTPDSPTTYIEVRLFRAEKESPLWGPGGPNDGILQISVVDYQQEGEIPPLAVCEKIAAAFPKGLALEYGSALVRILRDPSILSAIQDGQKATYPVSIRYRCSD